MEFLCSFITKGNKTVAEQMEELEFPGTQNLKSQGVGSIHLEGRSLVCVLKQYTASFCKQIPEDRAAAGPEDPGQNWTYLVDPRGRNLVGLHLLLQQLCITVTEWAT